MTLLTAHYILITVNQRPQKLKFFFLPTAAHFQTSSWRLVTVLSTANSGAAARPSPRSSWRRWRRPSRKPTTQTWL